MSKVNILWTNDNPITAKLMVFMYATSAIKQKWFDNVTIIIWGATAKLVAGNMDIQEVIKEAVALGVHVSACEACAKELGVYEQLVDLDLEVKYWGEPLSTILKDGESLMTI